MIDIYCEICLKPAEETTLYRNAPKGDIDAHWRCEYDLDPEYKPNKEVKEIVQIIERKAK